ncbi:MAG: hypothetical protein ACLFVJ_07935 [Persicimonas sp.]
MTRETRKSSRLSLSGILKGGHSRRSSDGADTGAKSAFDPKAYYYAAWHVVKNDISLLVWKLAADFVRSIVALGTLAFLGGVLAVQFRSVLDDAPGPIAAVDNFAASLASPGFLIGAAGVVFCAWLLGLMVEVLALSGIWGALAEGARGRRIRPFRTFLANLTSRFPGVLALRITTMAAQLAMVLLGVSLVVAIATMTGSASMADASVWLKGVLWAAPLTLLAGLVALIRLTMEIAAAPLIIEGRTLGDSILQGAVLVTRKFAQIYRLLLVAATLLLIPLFLYWGVLIFSNLTMNNPQLAPLVALMRLAGEAFLFASVGVLAVAFYAALFVYYAHQTGMIDTLPGNDDNDAIDSSDGNDEPSNRSDAVGRPAHLGAGRGMPRGPKDSRIEFDEETTIEQLLPDEYPNIIPLEDVLGGSDADEARTDEDDEPNSDLSGDDQER